MMEMAPWNRYPTHQISQQSKWEKEALYHDGMGTCMLTALTSKTQMMSISKQSEPKELTLWDFSSCPMTSKVTIASIRMTKGQYVMNFTLKNTSANHLVWTMFKKIGIFSIVMSYLWEEHVFLLFGPVRRNLTSSKVVHNMNKPRERINDTSNSCLSWKW